MSTVKGLIRALSRQVAGRVSQHDLFEKEGERAPCPSLDPITGARGGSWVRAVSLEELDTALGPGGGLRIVNHWATWCSGCVEELPELGRLHRTLGDRVQFLGLSWERFQTTVSMDQSLKDLAETMERHGLRWPTLVLNDGVKPETFFAQLELECQTVPQTWLVDDSGRVLFQVEAVLDAAAVDEIVSKVEALG